MEIVGRSTSARDAQNAAIYLTTRHEAPIEVLTPQGTPLCTVSFVAPPV